MKSILPCSNCIVMARCNALMYKDETSRGINAFGLYKKCEILKDYIHDNFKCQTEKNIWRFSLKAVRIFFLDDHEDSYFLTDCYYQRVD